jgi:hypothetical protein
MCPIDADFKHFHQAEPWQLRHAGKVSSIMRANVLSIMPAKGGSVTAD